MMTFEEVIKILTPIVAVVIILFGFYSLAWMTHKFTKDYTLTSVNNRCIDYHNTKTVKDAKNICYTIVYGENK
jgi:hypothetical protein